MFKTKIISLLLVLVFAISCLSSCAPAKTKSVGTVGEYEVAYEELYFLAFSYKKGLEAKYGEYDKLDSEKAKQFEEELNELVYSNIVTNHAILSLCKEEDLTLKSEGLEDRVDEYVEEVIIPQFDLDKNNYKQSLKEKGLTEHYVRFVASVDLLYSDFMRKTLEKSDVANDDVKMKDIIKQEFIRTWHVAVINHEGESVDENRAKAEAALEKYRSGSRSMYKLIGDNDVDPAIKDLDGIYFVRGSMEETYEQAAFALEVGEVSDVVETDAAFYIIQRLELEDNYIDKNLYDLKEKYIGSVIYGMLEEKKSELKFEPNEFAKELDIANLEEPAGNGLVIALVIGAVAVVVAGGVVGVILVRKRRTRALIERKKK